MKKLKISTIIAVFTLIWLLMGLYPFQVYPSMVDYCASPPFVSQSVPPNLLIIPDNSASMYDLAHISSGTSYCYDVSYSGDTSYYGYYEKDKIYNYDFTNEKFVEISSMPTDCTNTSGPFCVKIEGSSVTSAAFRGNFLNWLTMSKMDVEKKVLTGGKWDNTNNILTGESRGCAGRRFVKEYPGSGVVFAIRGSTLFGHGYDTIYVGGTTRIEIFEADAGWNPQACQDAIAALMEGNMGQAQTKTDECLGLTQKSNALAAFNHSMQTCWALGQGQEISEGDISRIKNTCEKVYDDIKNPDGTIPWDVLDTSHAAYVCTRIDPESSDPEKGYVGWCFGGWDAQNKPIWEVEPCVENQLERYCGILSKTEVIDPSSELPGTFSNMPAILVDSGVLGQLGNPAGELKNIKDEQVQPTGILDEFIPRVRLGLMTMSYYGSSYELDSDTAAKYYYQYSDKDGGNIPSPISDNNTGIINAINDMEAYSWTPFAEAFYEATRYFRGMASGYDSGVNYTSPIDYWCRKNCVILLSDGSSTEDQNIPGTYFSGTGATVTDSSFNVSDWVTESEHQTELNYYGTNYAKGVAHWAYVSDLIEDSTLEQKQNITFYIISALGSPGSNELLKDIAKYGGFEDKNDNNEPDLQEEWDKDGDGYPDNYYEAPEGKELEKKITKAIYNILKRASSGTAVSTLSTSTRGSGLFCQAHFFPLFISENNEEVSWIGNLRGFWVDSEGQIREDTTEDKKLILDEDKVMKYFFDESEGETKIHLYSSDATGKVKFPCSLDETKALLDSKAIWATGKKLWEMSASNRVIKTSIDGSSLTDFITGNASSLESYLRTYDQTDAENIINYVRGANPEPDVCLDSDEDPPACNSTGHRSRELTIDTGAHIWKLGDIVYSTPRILSHFPLGAYNIRYGDTTYTEFIKEKVYDPTATEPIKREDYLFVGANDGMLHCFYLGKVKEKRSETNPGLRAEVEGTDIGKEKWAYVPMNVLPYLKYLAYPDYCHIYYVDQRSMLIDASIGGDAGSNRASDGGSWRAVLIGELRFGGSPDPPSDAPCIKEGNIVDCSTEGAKRVGLSSIFALDITNPESPSLLWEFSDPDLGFTTSYPAIARVGGEDKNGNWYIVLGSGPTDYDGDVPPSTGYIYVINLKTGNLEGKLTVPVGTGNTAYVGDCIAVDPDNDYTVEAIYCGTVEKSGSSFTGRMLRILTNEQTPTKDANNIITNWEVTTLYNAGAPITASPDFALDDEGKLWCPFGTGKYFGQSDKTDESQNYIYGIKDICWVPNDKAYSSSCSTIADSEIFNATGVTVTATERDFICMCEGGEVNKEEGSCPSGSNKVVTEVTSLTVSGCGGYSNWEGCVEYINANYKGWKIVLSTSSPAERVISKSAVAGELALFTSFTPDTDICGFGGDSYLYSLYYKAGIPYKEPAVLLDTAFKDYQIQSHVHIGKGAPPIGEAIFSKQVGSELKTYIQLSTGEVVEIKQKPVFLLNKVQFWIEK